MHYFISQKITAPILKNEPEKNNKPDLKSSNSTKFSPANGRTVQQSPLMEENLKDIQKYIKNIILLYFKSIKAQNESEEIKFQEATQLINLIQEFKQIIFDQKFEDSEFYACLLFNLIPYLIG